LSNASLWTDTSVSAGKETWMTNPLSEVCVLDGNLPLRRSSIPMAKHAARRTMLFIVHASFPVAPAPVSLAPRHGGRTPHSIIYDARVVDQSRCLVAICRLAVQYI
jgi:hypothetical protein